MKLYDDEMADRGWRRRRGRGFIHCPLLYDYMEGNVKKREKTLEVNKRWNIYTKTEKKKKLIKKN